MSYSSRCRFLCALALAVAVGGIARAQTTPNIPAYLALNTITWTNPGPSAYQSMPIGNGDLGLNVWAETNGAVDFYIGKTDAWGDNVQGDEGLFKVGGVHLTLNPNPFTAGAPFSQALYLYPSQMQITEGSGVNAVTLLIWVDANHLVIRVQVTSAGTPVSVTASLTDWRLTASNPDFVYSGQTNYVGWYHRNSSSDDTHIRNWTYGALIEGPGMTNSTATNLVSTPGTNQWVSVYPLTTRTGTTAQWLTAVQSNITQLAAQDLATTWTNHQAWWSNFWNRSWIYISGNQNATNTTLGYVLQRYISACAGRGAYPIKFNGSLFVVENTTTESGTTYNYTPDGRRWGGQYWMQNTREMYWPMLEAGDLDMMPPFFDMFAGMISNNASEITSYYNHAGSYSAETSPFWGGVANVSTNVIPAGSGTFTERYFEGFMELTMMMLDYYDYTGDTNFVAQTLVPAAAAGLTFYDQHFGLDASGKMSLYPVNSLETYWDTDDPAPDIAGLWAILPRLLALPTNLVSTAQTAQWTRLLTEIPPLPTGTSGGAPVLLPYTGTQNKTIENGENTQLYAVFPYRIFGLDKPNLTLATNTFNKRPFYGLGWADWMPDAIQAAMLGLSSVAQQYTDYSFTNTDPFQKFPAFWRIQNDYVPCEDTGGTAMDALQKMILQTDQQKIMLLPAWPAGWNAVFKLNAPYNTTVQGTITNGTVINLVVTPSARLADVILMPGGGTAPATPTGLAAAGGNSQVTLTWTNVSGALYYRLKRSTAPGGPFNVISNNIPYASCVDTNVVIGTTYYYTVAAANPSGASADSSSVSAAPVLTVPGVPTGLTASVGDGQVTLNWFPSSGATNYNVKRSYTYGGTYGTIGSSAVATYTDTGLSDGTTYYYAVSAQNSQGESSNSAAISATPVAGVTVNFSSGAFTDNSVLALVGTPARELYGVSLGDGASRTTANGYVFQGYPSTNISYGGSGAYPPGAIFLGGGGASGDASFDAVLNNGELGSSSGALILSNLTAGATYNVLFLEADTRTGGEAGRSYTMTMIASNSVTSPSQVYAFPGGTPSLGGYILSTFTATSGTQEFENNASGYGYQLNAMLVGTVPANTPSLITAVNIAGGNVHFSGTNGPAGGSYRIMASSVLSSSPAAWTPVATNSFDSSGAFDVAIPLPVDVPVMFYRLVSP